MLVNPTRPEGQRKLSCVPGTRVLEDTFGIVGMQIKDPFNLLRAWTIECLYAPVRGRAIGGLRARLQDNLGFSTFCNQRDLEVLIGEATPGSWCQWLDQEYVGINDNGWIGFAIDGDDLSDDLYDRELLLRAQAYAGSILPTGIELRRRIHDGPRVDYEELLHFTWDADPDTGFGPDNKFVTLDNRWRSIERTPGRERDKLWYSLYQITIAGT
jgi:hypothetical protein